MFECEFANANQDPAGLEQGQANNICIWPAIVDEASIDISASLFLIWIGLLGKHLAILRVSHIMCA